MGYQVVGHSRALIRNKTEAVAVSALAGGIAGAIDGVAQIIVTLIIPDIINFPTTGFSSHDALLLALSPLSLVLVIAVTIIMSVIGGLVYIAKIAKIPQNQR